MAHETLKFKVQVEDNENWQPIYGGLEHHSFFMIYLMIVNYEEKNGDHWYTLKFKIQNFKGDITMGFNDVAELTWVTDEKRLNEIREGISDFDNRSESDKTEIKNNYYFNFRLRIEIKPFHVKSEYSPLPFKLSKKLDGLVLETVGDVKNPSIDLKVDTDKERNIPFYDPKHPENSRYINPYHYERAGDEYYIIGRKNKDLNEEFESIGGIGTLLTKCNPSRSIFI